MDRKNIDLVALQTDLTKARHTCAVAKQALADAEASLEELLAFYTSQVVYQHGDMAMGIDYEH